MDFFNIDLTEWWLSSFSLHERKTIFDKFSPNRSGIFGEVKDEPTFTIQSFKVVDEPVIPFLKNLSEWMKKDEDLSQRIYLKFIEISSYDPICDLEKLKNDREFENWIILRHLCLNNIRCMKRMDVKSASFSYGNYELAPLDCKNLHSKQFSLEHELNFIIDHWNTYKPKCRCCLLPVIEDGILID